jgi:hypothetical protein
MEALVIEIVATSVLLLGHVAVIVWNRLARPA